MAAYSNSRKVSLVPYLLNFIPSLDPAFGVCPLRSVHIGLACWGGLSQDGVSERSLRTVKGAIFLSRLVCSDTSEMLLGLLPVVCPRK